jgi:hypothetical protein
MRLLAGRKACRNFGPGAGEAGVPKSSLDGARESVWIKGLDNRHTELEDETNAKGRGKRRPSHLRLRRPHNR